MQHFWALPYVLQTKEPTYLISRPPGAPRPSASHNGRIPGCFPRRSVMSKKIRTWMISALAGVALFYVQAAAAQQETDWSNVRIKTNKVSGNIYLQEDHGEHIAGS